VRKWVRWSERQFEREEADGKPATDEVDLVRTGA
jgi:hypothetical protein